MGEGNNREMMMLWFAQDFRGLVFSSSLQFFNRKMSFSLHARDEFLFYSHAME